MRTALIFALLVAVSLGEWANCVQGPNNGISIVRNGAKGKTVAWAEYKYGMLTTGWNELTLGTSGSYPDSLQARCAGYLEGYLSAKDIWYSMVNWEYKSPLAEGARDFPVKNEKWIREQIKNKDKSDHSDYWNQVALVVQQMDGIREGYNARMKAYPSRQFTSEQFWYYQIDLELSDINATATKQPLSEQDLHCSSLVKISDDGKRLLSAQTMWSYYRTMLRVFKHLTLAYHANGTNAKTVSFSSYPGFITSNDDYFLTSQNMVVMETTNNVYNMSLYQYVTPQTVPYFIRIMVTNRMASSGQEWAKIMELYNSGTYNNQWIIVDNKKFTPGKPLVPGTLWVLEQLPGYFYGQDQTEYLKDNKHWSSYNIPFYPFIYNISGYAHREQTRGNRYSWANSPRGHMFKRDQDKVQDIATLKKFMRYNKYQTDPYALGDPCNGIAARCDLDTQSPSAWGALDCKLTSSEFSHQMTSEIVSGPTWDDQIPFSWTGKWANASHLGMPQEYKFNWIKVTAK